jgi:hypothetical protein
MHAQLITKDAAQKAVRRVVGRYVADVFAKNDASRGTRRPVSAVRLTDTQCSDNRFLRLNVHVGDENADRPKLLPQGAVRWRSRRLKSEMTALGTRLIDRDWSGVHQKFRAENMIRPGSYFCLAAVSRDKLAPKYREAGWFASR